MLNTAQAQAVRTAGNCLITACPGSGKTMVLSHRGEYLLTRDLKGKLLGVTFTAEAAAELKSRIIHRIASAKPRVICGTFHSLCKKQLERTGKRVKIVNEITQAELIRQAYKESAEPGDGLTLDAVTSFIESTKAAVNPILPDRLDPRVRAYEAYQEKLRTFDAYDFSDLLVLATRGMQQGTIEPFDVQYILADEYQDSDEVQAAWLHEHVRRGIEVCVVGDDDQAIYGWRFAQGQKALEDFRRVANATHIALDVTYRCAEDIMEKSARLITHNAERILKTLQTANRMPGETRVVRKEDRAAEFKAIEEAVTQSGCPGNWGILARTNSLLGQFDEQSKIKLYRVGGTSFWELKGPSLYLGLCRSLVHGDMQGVDAVLRRAGVNSAQMDELLAGCNSKEPGSLLRFLATPDKPRSKLPISILRSAMREWRRLLLRGTKKVDVVLVAISQYLTKHVRLYVRDRDPEERELDVRRLKRCAETLGKIHGTLARRIRFLEEDRERDDKKDLPKVMTLHAAKGLEFRHVWILGCEEGVLPSAGSPIEEERRLMYVGMTRAIETLTLSHIINEKIPPSRFIAEAGIR
jgi:DNA helicase II / ATP-dependent DNA helicase PcrA